VAGRRADPGRDQDGVQAAADPVGALVATEAVVGLEVKPVFDGDEVEQAALGLPRQVDPVGRGEEAVRPGVRLPPGGRCQPAPSSATARWGGSIEAGTVSSVLRRG